MPKYVCTAHGVNAFQEKVQLEPEQAEYLTLHFNSSNPEGHCANLTPMPTPGHRLSGIGSLGVVPVDERKERACCMALKRACCIELYSPNLCPPGTLECNFIWK